MRDGAVVSKRIIADISQLVDTPEWTNVGRVGGGDLQSAIVINRAVARHGHLWKRGAINHPDRSMTLMESDRILISPTKASSLRYRYLIHRRPDFSHDAYLARYETIHSECRLQPPNIEDYIQLNIDLNASKSLTEATRLRVEACDSMSELTFIRSGTF